MENYLIAATASQIAAYATKAARSGAKVYFAAGTTDLYVQWKEGFTVEPNIFIDIAGVSELKKIKETKSSVIIGAGATFTDIINSAVCRKHLELLAEAAKTVGSPLIRNRATIGGNIANSSPAGDSLPALAALDASLILRRGAKRRKLPLSGFFTGPKRNVLTAGEFIESVSAPKNDFNFCRFLKLGSRKALAISKISLAAAMRRHKGAITSISIAAGAVGPTVMRCRRTEEILTGARLDDEAKIALAVKTIAAEILPIDDFRSTAEYRRDAASALLERILADAARLC